MNRVHIFVVGLILVYGCLIVLLALGVSTYRLEPAKFIWTIAATVALSGSALELTLIPFWILLKLTGTFDHDPYVKLTLAEDDRTYLAGRSPRTAILMPAHKEATTEEDRRALVQRLLDIMRVTPSWTTVYLLFDSPDDQIQSELAVVEETRRRLCQQRRAHDAQRLQYEEYRRKPSHMKNKPGSIVTWLDGHARRFEFFFVLDADSSLPSADAKPREQRDALERMVLAMLQHPSLSMIQSSIQIRHYSTAFGWFQWVSAAMAPRYHGPLFQWILHGCVPSYGHNVLFRTSDFVRHVRNTLQFLSHDFLDAADLASAGKCCVSTHRVVTFELCEESVVGWCVREARWARGNLQWIAYWLTKPKLPLASRIALGIGIMAYVGPLMTSILMISSVLLVSNHATVLLAGRPLIVSGLIGLVTLSLLLPRMLASRSLTEFNLSTLIGALVSPSLMLLRGVVFLLGAFGSGWTPRGARSLKLDLDHIGKLGKWFYPVAAFGLVLDLMFLNNVSDAGTGVLILRLHVLLLIASPLLAYALSQPLIDRSQFHERT